MGLWTICKKKKKKKKRDAFKGPNHLSNKIAASSLSPYWFLSAKCGGGL